MLFHYTHDILRSQRSVDHLLGCARPGSRISIAGICFFPWWCGPLNLFVYLKNRGYNGAPGELRTPWDRIAPRLTDWRISRTQWGMGYLASGLVPVPRYAWTQRRHWIRDCMSGSVMRSRCHVVGRKPRSCSGSLFRGVIQISGGSASDDHAPGVSHWERTSDAHHQGRRQELPPWT
jgi:hypothetical protein